MKHSKKRKSNHKLSKTKKHNTRKLKGGGFLDLFKNKEDPTVVLFDDKREDNYLNNVDYGLGWFNWICGIPLLKMFCSVKDVKLPSINKSVNNNNNIINMIDLNKIQSSKSGGKKDIKRK
jgi:hypothetical protein